MVKLYFRIKNNCILKNYDDFKPTRIISEVHVAKGKISDRWVCVVSVLTCIP